MSPKNQHNPFLGDTEEEQLWQNQPSGAGHSTASDPTLPSTQPTPVASLTVQTSSLYPTITQTPVSPPEDQPPAYEAIISKDIPQLHDNYEHLQGPIRGIDDKTRFPSESISTSRYQSGGAGSSSSAGPSVPRTVPEPDYGSTGSNAYAQGIVHSPTSRGPDLGLTGQIALGSDDEDEFAADVDRLLGEDESGYSGRDDEPDSCWTIAGDGKAWGALAYLVLGLLPWTLFCFGWTLCMMMLAGLTMIIPPLGYLFTIAGVTSWRALARADLVLSASLVSLKVQQKYPHTRAPIYIPLEPSTSTGSPPSIFGRAIPLPDFVLRRIQRRRTQRARRPRNVWHRCSVHWSAMAKNKHTIKSMFYFLTWKLLLALPVFIVILFLTCISLPFAICFLPTLLVVSKTFANWQYRWAVTWLSEKPAPVVLP